MNIENIDLRSVIDNYRNQVMLNGTITNTV